MAILVSCYQNKPNSKLLHFVEFLMRSLQKCQEQYTELHEENLQLDHEKELMSEQLDYWKSQQDFMSNYQKDL